MSADTPRVPISELPTSDVPELPPLGERSAPSEPSGPSPSRRYRVKEELGRGGMGRVIEAEDQELLRPVAMKVMRSADPVDAHRFTLEAQITGQLDHPNVLPIYDLGADPHGKPFITMKLIRDHLSLADVIEGLRRGDPELVEQYTFRRRVQVIQQVCHALHYAHQRGVLHRDLKPGNVVVGTYGEVYLVDWGICRVVPGTPIGDLAESGELFAEAPVQAGLEAEVLEAAEEDTIVGTPPYMSPEHILSGQTDPRSDVYSLVAVLYELLTLHHYLGGPFATLDQLRAAVISPRRIMAETFVNPHGGRVPRSLSMVCLKGLAIDPEERFQSALELEEALQRYLEGRAPIVCPGTCMQRILSEMRDAIDQRPYVLPMLVVLSGSALLGWVIFTTMFYFRH